MAAPAAFFSTTRNTPRVCSARHGRSSSPRCLRRLLMCHHHLLSLPFDTRLHASPTRHRRPRHLRQPLSTVHAAFVASPRVLPILSAVPTLRSKPALARTTNTTRTPCTSPTHALRPSSVPPHRLLNARSCRAARVCRAPPVYAAHAAAVPHHPHPFVPSPRAPTICSVDPPSPLDSLPARTSVQSPALPACATDIPHCLCAPMASDHRADPFRRPTAQHPRLL
ncbi:hypothetical protein DFH08DRAFT_329242 [Mycena albidolilacea]|uniref:Uncharacterized protein n=1 Tax=Mycena albidolilacea TaxID=1033008 RepID=A0AAD7AMM8_9AGAR|nr:hypothetical protein DFH08DRAFT_329242 [Mycena albidolilacea]